MFVYKPDDTSMDARILLASHILIWKRFDIFVGLTRSRTEFTTYVIDLNRVHITIKFMYELSETELTFLDITLYKGNS